MNQKDSLDNLTVTQKWNIALRLWGEVMTSLRADRQSLLYRLHHWTQHFSQLNDGEHGALENVEMPHLRQSYWQILKSKLMCSDLKEVKWPSSICTNRTTEPCHRHIPAYQQLWLWRVTRQSWIEQLTNWDFTLCSVQIHRKHEGSQAAACVVYLCVLSLFAAYSTCTFLNSFELIG